MAQSISNTEILESLYSTEVSDYESDSESVLTDDSYTTSTSSYEEQILFQLQVTNGLMGIQIALDILFLALFFFVFFIKTIKNNVTNFIT